MRKDQPRAGNVSIMVAAFTVVFVASAQAQQTIVVFDCVEGLDNNFTPGSLQSAEVHQEIFQILEAQTQNAILRELFIPVGASQHNGQPFVGQELFGKIVRIVGRYGTFTPGVGFSEDPELSSYAFDIPVTLGAQNLQARVDPFQWDLTVQFLDPSAPVIPAGAALNLGVIGMSFNFGLPDEEVFAVFASRTCIQGTSGTLDQFLGPVAPLHDFLDQVFGGALAPGRVAMRVTVEPFGASIPTVSEWGLVAMTLLMMTVGTLVCRSRMGKPVGVRERNGGWGAG